MAATCAGAAGQQPLRAGTSHPASLVPHPPKDPPPPSLFPRRPRLSNAGSRSFHAGVAPANSITPQTVPFPPNPPRRAPQQPRGRYRRRAQSSSVDETLFGEPWVAGGESPPHPAFPQRLGSSSPVVVLRDVREFHGAPPSYGYKPKSTRIITKDVVRDIIMPDEKPETILIIGKKQFERIKESAGAPSQEERQDKMTALKAKQDAVYDALFEARRAERRKAELQDKMEQRPDLEEERRERDQQLLQRANRMRMEEEEEMRQLSSLFLNSKCNMIRDKQVLEKRLIHKEMTDEELRLDKMMEMEWEKGVAIQEELENRRRQELISARQEIVKQMEQRAEERALKEEQKYQEGLRDLERMEQMKIEDRKAWEKKQERQREIDAEIKRVNNETLRMKEQRQEQERLEDERVLQYQREKMEREAALEAEQERIRQEKEKELARLRAMQQKSQDWRAEMDALRAKRNQEASDREWRRQQLEKARKKVEVEEHLRLARLEQVAQKEHTLAMQMEAERQDFYRVLREQQEQLQRLQQEQARKAELHRAHARELQQQIQEERQRRQQERSALLEEGRRQRQEAQQRCQRLARLGQLKMEEFRATGIPEKYCAQVERRACKQGTPMAT